MLKIILKSFCAIFLILTIFTASIYGGKSQAYMCGWFCVNGECDGWSESSRLDCPRGLPQTQAACRASCSY